MKAFEMLTILKDRISVKYKDVDALSKRFDIQSDKLDSFMDENKQLHLKSMKETVYSILDENELSALKDVFLDKIPYESINAFTAKVDDGYIVVINERLSVLIFAWNQLHMYSVENNKNLNNYGCYFAPIIDCFLNPLSEKALPEFLFDRLSKRYQDMVILLTRMGEQFILAHELSHIILGHVDNSTSKELLNDAFWETYPAQNDFQQKEFDADIQAVKWLLRLAKSESKINPLQYQVFLFLNVFTVFHYTECNLGFPDTNSTHPSVISRLINIRDHFGDDIFDFDGYTISNMIEDFKDISTFQLDNLDR